MDVQRTSHSGASQNSSVAERRREDRIPCRRPIELVPYGDSAGSAVRAEMTDCSVHGIGVMLKRPMNAGDSFLLKLKASGTTVVLYTVRNCRCIDHDAYRVGAEFTAYIVAPAATNRESIVDLLVNAGTA